MRLAHLGRIWGPAVMALGEEVVIESTLRLLERIDEIIGSKSAPMPGICSEV